MWLTIANLADTALTAIAFVWFGGSVETNILVARVMDTGGIGGFVAYKLLVGVLLVWLLLTIKTRAMLVVVTASAVLLTIVSILNLIQLVGAYYVLHL